MLSKKFRNKHITVGIDGTIYHIIPNYRHRLLKLITIIFLSFVVYIFKHIAYIPVTVIGHTIYAKIIAGTVKRHNIQYKFCKTNSRVITYETSRAELIEFEGASNMTSSEQLPVVTCNVNELIALEAHTNLHNLDKAQSTVLQHMDRVGGVHMTSLNELINNIQYDAHITSIDKISNNLFYITSCDTIWLTSLILTDTIEPLQAGETVIGFIVSPTIESTTNYETEQDKIVVETIEGLVTMQRKSLYYVEDDLSITSYSRNLLAESQLYTLRDPRPFVLSNLCTIHPFHLPTVWDPLLSLMIVTTAVITQQL